MTRATIGGVQGILLVIGLYGMTRCNSTAVFAHCLSLVEDRKMGLERMGRSWSDHSFASPFGGPDKPRAASALASCRLDPLIPKARWAEPFS